MVGLEPVPEFRFNPARRFRFDYAWPENKAGKVAVELEGGTWCIGKSRHTTGAGYASDMIKYNIATEMGWRVLRYQPGKVDFEQVKRVLQSIPVSR